VSLMSNGARKKRLDPLTPERRREVMRRIPKTDTRPELIVRKLTHAMGYRYRLHYRKVPGTPDLAFPARRKAIYVHGCFWHQHPGCVLCRQPKSRLEYWGPKLARNRERDAANQERLREIGWESLIIWECETRDEARVARRVGRFLEGGRR